MDLIDTGDIAADLNLQRDYVTRKVVERHDAHADAFAATRRAITRAAAAMAKDQT